MIFSNILPQMGSREIWRWFWTRLRSFFFKTGETLAFFSFLGKITFGDAIFVNDEKGNANGILTHLEDAGCDTIVPMGLVNVKFPDVVSDVGLAEMNFIYRKLS